MGVCLHWSGYKFFALADRAGLRARLLETASAAGLKGSILVSPEGVNFYLAGERRGLDDILALLEASGGAGGWSLKESACERPPYDRLRVRLKREIIAFGVEGIDPVRQSAPRLDPRELKRWLDEGRSLTLLDTRNDYEIALGTFRGAHAIGITHFRDFPEAAEKLDPALKQQTVVTFCTGGIRCEKAGPYLLKAGFTSVYQLDGGILRYFEECGAAHYDGDCYVFDQRVGLDSALQESGGRSSASLAPNDTEAPDRSTVAG